MDPNAGLLLQNKFMEMLSQLSLPDHQKNALLEAHMSVISSFQKSENFVAVQAADHPKFLCPEHPDDLFSKTVIDSELSKTDEEEIRILKFIYREIAYSPKMSYFAGDPKFAMRNLNFSEPNIENIIVGECQSGKSAEIAWTAWCSYFILGCLPVIYVRNNGGRTQGIEDMMCAVMNLNVRIDLVLKTAEMSIELSGLREKIRRCIECGRFRLEIATDINKIQANGLVFRSATVFISLLNASQLKKMMEPFKKSRKQWFFATLGSQHGDDWEVQYHDSAEKELRTLDDLKTSSGKKIALSAVLQPGIVVRARKSAELGVQDGLLKAMQKYVEKEGKRRLLFIMDEADLSVGNPERNKNQGEKLMYQNSERGDFYGENRGAREYVYGSVFITATPQALFICAWQLESRAGGSSSPEGTESDREQRAADGEASYQDCVVVDRNIRRRALTPHLVYADRPDNYIAYRTNSGPQHGLFVERRVLPERFQRVKNMTQMYQKEWILCGKGTAEAWREKEQVVILTKEASQLWPGIELRYNCRAKTAQVHMPPARSRSVEQDRIYDSVKDSFRQAKEDQSGQTIWDQDGESIQEMLMDMIVDAEQEAYRHALIVSDKTKTIHKQRTLAQEILFNFPGAGDLAVAVYNCTDGITVSFSQAMHSRGDVLQRAFDAVQQAALRLQGAKERCGLSGGAQAGHSCVSVSHSQLVISHQPIGVMYEGLKGLCSRIVVITGEIGGRGVSYHDLSHERILTDMYTAQEVLADATVPQHGELLTQVLGRLNTIETFSAKGQAVPAVRLWATQSVHDLHCLVLEEVRELSDAVVRERDYRRALWARPIWITGETRAGDPIHLRMSRPAFSAKKERLMRGAGFRKAAITERRNRGVRSGRPERWFPAKSQCKCVERRPNAADLEDGDELPDEPEGDGRWRRYAWDPRSGEAWSDSKHSLYEVEVPLTLVDDVAAARFVAEHARLVEPGRRQPWRFLTLQAARRFIAAGAAGEREAQIVRVVHPEPLSGSSPSQSDSDSDSCSSGESDSESASPPPRRRRLDYTPPTDDPAGDGGGC